MPSARKLKNALFAVAAALLVVRIVLKPRLSVFIETEFNEFYGMMLDVFIGITLMCLSTVFLKIRLAPAGLAKSEEKKLWLQIGLVYRAFLASIPVGIFIGRLLI